MKKISTKPVRKSKKLPLQRVTGLSRRVRAGGISHAPAPKKSPRRSRALQDALVRQTLLRRYKTGPRTWEQVGKPYGLNRAQTYLIAHGQRPVPAELRERIRAEHSPRKLRRFIRNIAVPFLIRNWRA